MTSESKLSRLPVIRLKRPFQANWEFTATSLSLKGTFVICVSRIASSSVDPGGVSLRISTSSTCSKGTSLSRSFRCSWVRCGTSSSGGVDGGRDTGKERDPMMGDEVGDARMAWTSAMASRITRIDRTTLSRTTARHDARSALNAWEGDKPRLRLTVLEEGSTFWE